MCLQVQRIKLLQKPVLITQIDRKQNVVMCCVCWKSTFENFNFSQDSPLYDSFPEEKNFNESFVSIEKMTTFPTQTSSMTTRYNNTQFL